MDNPLVSVVIPVYNVAPWVRECLDSVTGQTYTNLEIIVIDDGSTDEGGRICDEYSRDSRVRVIHQKNGGLGHARNVGMDLATGKYIVFLDSDDYWRDDTVEELCRMAEKDRTQVIAFSANVWFDGVESVKHPDYSYTVQTGIVQTGVDSLRTKNREYYSQACLRFYLLSYLREQQFRFDEGVIHEDESFSFLAYLCAERVECVGKRYYTRRYRAGSIMMTLDLAESAKGYLAATETVYRFCRESELSGEMTELCGRKIKGYICSIFGRYRTADREDRRRIAEQAGETFRKLSRDGKILPVTVRVAIRNFHIGYALWSLKLRV